MQLDEGWNLISVSSNTDDLDYSIDHINSKCDRTGGPWAWDRDEEDWIGHEIMEPTRGYWVQVESSCNLDLLGDYSYDDLDLEEGWNLISASNPGFHMSRFDSECSGERTGGPWWDDPSDSDWNGRENILPEKGYWVKMTDDCTLDIEDESGDEPPSEPPEDPVVDDYLELEDGSIPTDTVASDGDDFGAEFSFDRDSAVSNDVYADLGLHFNEDSTPVEVFDVPDSSSTQTISADWQDVWEEFESSTEDISAQLVLESRQENDYTWNEDSMDIGSFDLERCTHFSNEIDPSEWEYDYNRESTSACLDEASIVSTGDSEFDLKVSSENGACGEIEFDSTYWDTEGTEVLTIDFDTLKDVDHFTDNVELEIRHFTGGPSDNAEWITVVDEDVEDIEDDEFVIEFEEALEDDLHNYNKVQITLEGDNCSDEFEVSGKMIYEENSESLLTVNLEDEYSDPVYNANVEAGDKEKTTNTQGKARFDLKNNKQYIVEASKSGYYDSSDEIELGREDKEIDMTIVSDDRIR